MSPERPRPHRAVVTLQFSSLSAHDRAALTEIGSMQGRGVPLVGLTIKSVLIRGLEAESPFERPAEITMTFVAADVEITRASE